MSPDEDVARKRLLPRPHVRSGPLRDFKDAVYELYLTEQPTLDQLEQRIRVMAEGSDSQPACEPTATPKRDTIRAVISSSSLPQNVRIVTAVAAGLVFHRHTDLSTVNVADDSTIRRIRHLWARAAARRSAGRPISEVRAVEDLGVHSVGRVGADRHHELPPYIERDHDRELRRLVANALSGRSGLAVLVCDSTCGKTRACVEALHWSPEEGIGSLASNGWRVWPSRVPTPDTTEDLLDELPNIDSHTVIWLDEAQRFLLDPPAPVAQRMALGFSELLADPANGPILMLGTLWPAYWRQLTAPRKEGEPDQHSAARALISNSGIRVESHFTAQERQAARATGDLLLTAAADEAVDGEVAQHLAGVPDLRSRYELGSAAERAIIHAAMDARRLGHREALSAGLLRSAAPALLTDGERRRLRQELDWFDRSVGELTRIGTTGGRVLEELEGGAYRLADYLDQLGREQRYCTVPPEPFWDAIAAHVADADDLNEIAHRAESRLRYRIAARLLTVGVDAGHFRCASSLMSHLDRAGHREEAEEVTRRYPDPERANLLLNLAEIRAWGPPYDFAEARRLCAEASQTDDLGILSRIAHLLSEVDDDAGARTIYERIAQEADPDDKAADLAEALERIGDTAGADRLALQKAAAGDVFAVQYRVMQRMAYRDIEGAKRLSEMATAAGFLTGMQTFRFTNKPHVPDSPQLTVSLAVNEVGASTDAWSAQVPTTEKHVRITMDSIERGDLEAAKRTIERLAEESKPDADGLLAVLAEVAGQREDTQRLAESAARAGKSRWISEIVALREETDRAAAEEFAVRALHWATNNGVITLSELREKSGDLAAAERLAQLAADSGDYERYEELAKARGNTQDRQLLLYGLNADGSYAEPW